MFEDVLTDVALQEPFLVDLEVKDMQFRGTDKSTNVITKPLPVLLIHEVFQQLLLHGKTQLLFGNTSDVNTFWTHMRSRVQHFADYPCSNLASNIHI